MSCLLQSETTYTIYIHLQKEYEAAFSSSSLIIDYGFHSEKWYSTSPKHSVLEPDFVTVRNVKRLYLKLKKHRLWLLPMFWKLQWFYKFMSLKKHKSMTKNVFLLYYIFAYYCNFVIQHLINMNMLQKVNNEHQFL